MQEKARRRAQRKFWTYFPDDGPYRRELYPRHLMFFALGGYHEPFPGVCPGDCDGSPHRERLALAANRVGKTETMGGYEMTCHLTGRYPEWWPGHRFPDPVQAWAAGDTRNSTRDVQQFKLLGPPGAIGTGLIPGDDIVSLRPMQGVPNAYEQIIVKHHDPNGRYDGDSILGMKSYDMGREVFQGTERHVIWLDEECPEDVMTECVTRTMATGGFNGGLLILTFTPLKGMTNVVLSFLPDGKMPGE